LASLWAVVTSPAGGVVTFGDATAIVTTAEFSLPGEYILRLTASDGEKEGFDEVTVTVLDAALNSPPVVDAGADQTVIFEGDPTVIDLPALGPANDPFHVSPTLITDPVTSGSADDPAIWVNPDDPAQSLIIGTGKGGGLYVYDMAGHQLQRISGSDLNNVDVAYGFEFNGEQIDLVAASNQSTQAIEAYKVNPANLTLERIGSIPVGMSVYGYASAHDLQTGKDYGIVSSKTGEIRQWELGSEGLTLTGTLVRTLNLGSVVEGLVADGELGHLYVAQEHGGLYRYGLDPSTGTARTQVDTTFGGHLTADTEGLALYYGKNGTGYLIASAQGANRFVVYRREGNNEYLASFDVAGVSSTDGIDVVNVPLGPRFEMGAFIAQNSNQDFRLVPWKTIAAAGNLSIYTGSIGSTPGWATAILDGTVVDDGQPDPPGTVTTTWTRLSGPGSVMFADAGALDTTATFDFPGTYVLQLDAFDGILTTTDTVTIQVRAVEDTLAEDDS
jgi:3-phytase